MLLFGSETINYLLKEFNYRAPPFVYIESKFIRENIKNTNNIICPQFFIENDCIDIKNCRHVHVDTKNLAINGTIKRTILERTRVRYLTREESVKLGLLPF